MKSIKERLRKDSFSVEVGEGHYEHVITFEDAEEIIKQYAFELIDVFAEIAIEEGKLNKTLVKQRKELLKEQLK